MLGCWAVLRSDSLRACASTVLDELVAAHGTPRFALLFSLTTSMIRWRRPWAVPKPGAAAGKHKTEELVRFEDQLEEEMVSGVCYGRAWQPPAEAQTESKAQVPAAQCQVSAAAPATADAQSAAADSAQRDPVSTCPPVTSSVQLWCVA